MPRIFMLFAVVFLMTGCSPSTPIPASTPAFTVMPAPTRTKLPENEWRMIRMNHSGGIMGLSRSIEISADGAYKIADDRTRKTINGTLAADDLSELKKLDTSPRSFERTETAICADCFLYDIVIQGGGKNIEMKLNDITLPESGLEPLVTYLRNLIDQALNK